MKKPIQTFAGFVKDLSFALVIEFLLFLLSMVHFSWKSSFAVFGIAAITTVPFIIYFRYHRFFKMLTTSALGYYYSFDSDDNLQVYREAKANLYYLGISANSILEYLRHWDEDNAFPSKCHFLLMDPDNMEALLEQKRFEKGICLDEDTNLSQDVVAQLRSEAEIEAERIRSAIAALNSVNGLRGKIEIRHYNEFIPWWMYIVDEKKIYMGILKAGRRGQDSSVMTMIKNEDFPAPFDPIKYKWDSLWRRGKPARLQ